MRKATPKVFVNSGIHRGTDTRIPRVPDTPKAGPGDRGPAFGVRRLRGSGRQTETPCERRNAIGSMSEP
ncbi:hypothetical protein GCM10010330_55550 [Streptomyces tendae]|nr:hypothetical protein GCM10010330_55550 [Streptomyces tendae]